MEVFTKRCKINHLAIIDNLKKKCSTKMEEKMKL